MKTVTMELNSYTLAAFVNLLDFCLKSGGVNAFDQAAMVHPLLKAAQLDLNKQNEADKEIENDFDEKTEVITDG